MIASGRPRQRYRYNIGNYNFGGPLVLPKFNRGKKNLFFFFNQEYQNLVTMFAVKQLTERLCRRSGVEPGTAASLPALGLALAVVSFALTVASNQLSRRIEACADTFALELTNDPRQFIEMERDLSLSNVADPDPPRWARLLLGTHPAIVERLGIAEAHRRGARAA